jgi:hypothetical protein
VTLWTIDEVRVGRLVRWEEDEVVKLPRDERTGALVFRRIRLCSMGCGTCGPDDLVCARCGAATHEVSEGTEG